MRGLKAKKKKIFEVTSERLFLERNLGARALANADFKEDRAYLIHTVVYGNLSRSCPGSLCFRKHLPLKEVCCSCCFRPVSANRSLHKFFR